MISSVSIYFIRLSAALSFVFLLGCTCIQDTSLSTEHTGLEGFTKFAEQRAGKKFPTYKDLHAWSVDDTTSFWKTIWDFAGIIGNMPADATIENPEDFLKVRFFETASLNYTENILRPRPNDTPTVIYWREDGFKMRLTYGELYDQVSQVRQEFQQMGLKPGDRVAAIVSPTPQTLVTMLAVNSLGGVWSSCGPELGVTAILDRVGQIEPKFLVAADKYAYKGQTYEVLQKVEEIEKMIPTIQKCIILPFSEGSKIEGYRTYADIMDVFAPAPIEFERFSFDHPLFILYTSGTTGKPKCIVHGTGGALLSLARDYSLLGYGRSKIRLLGITSCSWVSWNWSIPVLQSLYPLMLYDGSPFYPSKDALFRYVEEEKVTDLWVSPAYINHIQKERFTPGSTFNLTHLKYLTPVAGDLPAAGWEYVKESISPIARKNKMFGSTETMDSVLINYIDPNYLVPFLGVQVQIFNDQGQRVIGERGMMVITKPFPSKPLGLWNDPEHTAFNKTYFSHFPGIWTQGDEAEETPEGYFIPHGRADAVLKPHGIRMGPAEIYNVVEQIDKILDSIVVGQSWENDVRVILFVKLKEGETLTPQQMQRIKDTIRTNLSPRHVPAKIFQVSNIPRTHTGKKVELTVRDIINGKPVININAIQNPECLKEFELIAQNELR